MKPLNVKFTSTFYSEKTDKEIEVFVSAEVSPSAPQTLHDPGHDVEVEIEEREIKEESGKMWSLKQIAEFSDMTEGMVLNQLEEQAIEALDKLLDSQDPNLH